MSQHVMFNAVLSSHPALFIQGEWRIGNGVSFEKQDPMSQQRLWQARAADHTDVTLACHA
ncbi:N-succinylglutamate 5-semialdehyde dehydrogenase domain protein, partial [Yersinia pestis PY-101]